MSYDYSENQLIQESSGELLRDELGWEVKLAYNEEKLGVNGTFGRKSYKDILLTKYFRNALKKFNPWINETQLNEAEKAMLNDDEFRRVAAQHRSAVLDKKANFETEEENYILSLLKLNEEKYFLIRDGIPVNTVDVNGRKTTKHAMVIDFANPANNEFLAIKELKIHGDLYRRRTDIVGFVNGIPLLFVELKRNDIDVQNAFTDNYSDYLDTIPHLFYYNAFLILSNGGEAKVGTIGSKYEFFHEWKRLAENDTGNVALETMLRGICCKENFIDLLENFILYDHSNGTNVKILARNHQYLGVNEAVKAYEARKINNGKLGVFWHTQGSGKSYSMLFLAKKIRRKFTGKPTIIILTDRDELNKQISDTFENCGILGKVPASKFMATSGENLIQKIKDNSSFIFTLIQKFNKSYETPLPTDNDIIVMSDEAHRSQYGIFADNIMKLIPNAARIGFTGTPLLSSDNITERTFGSYVSIYDFNRAVEDGATVPLYYENRGEKILKLKNPEITKRILDAIDQADMGVLQQDKLEAKFAKEIHILTAEPRLRAIAHDFVCHYSYLWESGKAMFVCLNKVTCVRMYNFVQEYWQEEIKRLKKQIKQASQQEAQSLIKKLYWMQETEMAVVISQEQNEIKTFKKWNLDIEYHRKKMNTRELDKEFKATDNPLRIVFVCAMWLTGFDVKCLSCLYLDKPLKAHTLMQTIARANRVAEGKSNGLVIDYIGIVKALRKALADYTTNLGKEKTDPTIDKDVLIKRVIDTVNLTKTFLKNKGFNLQNLVEAKGFQKVELIQIAASSICETIESKKIFSTYAVELRKVVKYLDKHDITDTTLNEYDAIKAIHKALQEKRKHVDDTDLMVEINSIINDYIKIETPKDGEVIESRQFDISSIDFEILHREFSKSKKKNLALKDLQDVVQQQLNKMLLANPNRMDYYDRYQKIIDAYNKEQNQATIEKTFMDLMNLASKLDQEEQRYIREGFRNNEELAVYDMLFRNDLNSNDIKKIKKVASDLLVKIKSKINELSEWTRKEETRDTISNIIRDTLWAELPEVYDESSISEYKNKIYDYVVTRYSSAA